jgi:outer membrane receptor protein involved in Fe transport
MTMNLKDVSRSGASLAAIAAMLLPAAALAQAAPEKGPATAQSTADAGPIEEIVVTGSNIRGAIESGALAVSVLNASDLESFGANSTGELFEFIAQAGSAEINGAADGPNDARGDVATVNLRGLGTGNTLILLNGRRIAAHAVNQDIGSTPRQIVNVNAFPAAGIDRVEVLRDGASALYGADATAGVVNTILDADFDRVRATMRYSGVEGTGNREFSVDGAFGFKFNQERTRVLLSFGYTNRNALFASELGPQFNTVDKRGFLGDNPFGTDTVDFRNTSTSSPFGQFQAGFVNSQGVFVGRRVRQGAQTLTSTTGVFHIQPFAFPGTRAELPGGSEGRMGLDDGTLDVGLRYDFAANQPNNSLNQGVNIANDPLTAKGRQLISEIDRVNVYTAVEHDFDNGIQAFGEVLFYGATTNSSRAPQPLDSGLAFLIIPRTNYWNPFGAVGSPNRLPGLNTTDVPAGGVDVLLQNWRPTDLASRRIKTNTETYRILGGLRGEWDAWSWEAALANSGNWTSDTEGSRLSKTLLAAELAKSTPDAINPFGGPNANTEAQWQRARIATTNVGQTRLTTADFRVSNAEAFEGWAAPIGLAFGAEWRNDFYSEDRDPRLDGTIVFDPSNVSGESDVVGVSPTRDSSARRNVFSGFAEALVPLHRGEGTFINDLTLQLAARAEYFDDIKTGVIKPKVALSWFPVRSLNFRATYAEGFRAPNLVQLNRGDVSRLNLGVEDFWRAAVTGDPASTGDAYVPSVRRSNPDLKNEDTKTFILGGTLDLAKAFKNPAIRRLAFSFDYWRFEQRGVIGAFGDEEALALDFLLRKEGSFNPNVIRSDPTVDDLAAFAAWNAANPTDQRSAAGSILFINDPYINLDKQVADGFDFGFFSEFQTGIGRISFGGEATYLKTLDVFRNDLLTAVANDPQFGGAFDSLAVDRVELDGNPKWRLTGTFSWDIGDFGIGGAVRYVAGFDDTNADLIINGEQVFWRVEEDVRVNLFADYEFRIGGNDRIRARFGVNNLFDKAPPLADESLGYRPDYHSLKGREYYLQLRGSF